MPVLQTAAFGIAHNISVHQLGAGHKTKTLEQRQGDRCPTPHTQREMRQQNKQAFLSLQPQCRSSRLQSQPSSKITPPKSDVVWQRSFCSFVLPASPGRGTGILSGVTPNVSPGDLWVSIVAQLITSEDKRVLNTVRSGPEDAISSTSQAAAAHSFTTSSQLFYERLELNTSQPDSVSSQSLVSPLSLLGHSACLPACPSTTPPPLLFFLLSFFSSLPPPQPHSFLALVFIF